MAIILHYDDGTNIETDRQYIIKYHTILTVVEYSPNYLLNRLFG